MGRLRAGLKRMRVSRWTHHLDQSGVGRLLWPVVLAAGLVLLHWAVLEDVDALGWDVALRLRGTEPPDPRIVIVAVDDSSLAAIGAWPWPPSLLARLFSAVYNARPALVGVDLLLSHPFEEYFPETYDIPTVVGVALAPGPGTAGPAMEWQGPLEELNRKEAFVAGHLHAAKDADGVCRQIPLFIQYGGRVIWAFSLELARLALAVPENELRAQRDGIHLADYIVVPQTGKVGGAEDAFGVLPRIEGDLLPVNYRGSPGLYPYVPAAVLLDDPSIAADQLGGRIVLIGATAYSLGDHLATPFSGRTESPGVEIHANALDTLLNRRFLRALPEPWISLLVAAVALVLWSLFEFRPELHAPLWYALLLAIIVGGPLAIFLLRGWYLPLASTVFTAVLTVSFSQGLRYVRLNRLLNRRFRELQRTVRETRASALPISDPSLRSGGRLEWKLAVLGDATESALRLAQQRGELTAFVSHELKTPLTSIRGFAELLEMDALLSPEDRVEAARTIREETDRLYRMILDYLDVTRLEQGQRPLRCRSVALPDLVERAVTTVQAGDSRRIRVTTADGRAGWNLTTDPDLLLQVLVNLLSNALKFSPPDSPVDVRLSRFEGNWFVVEVEDRGRGISQEELSRIFDKFYRGRAEGDPDASGSGLGLAFVKEAVTALGGEVTVESRLGAGSVFRVRLPGSPGDGTNER